jgi:hypothetical protein
MTPEQAKTVALVGRVMPSATRLFRRVYSQPNSRKQAMKAKCLECVGWEEPRERIRECMASACPLWAWRPYQRKESGRDEEDHLT